MTHIVATFFTIHSWVLAQAASPAVTVGDPGRGAIGHGFIYALVIGLIIGVVAKFLTPGRDPGGCIITSLIGIGGSLVAYIIGKAVGFYGQGDTPGIIASVVGAVILLVAYHAIIGKKNV